MIPTSTRNADESSCQISLYLKQVESFPLLSPEEERATVLRMHQATEALKQCRPEASPASAARLSHQAAAARNRLIEANLRLVISIARKYEGRGLSLPDLIQEGNIGLSQEVDKFDPTQGCRFSTFITPWISHAITRAIANKARLIRIPVNRLKSLNKVLDLQNRLSQQLGHAPSPNEIAAAWPDASVSPREIRSLLLLLRQPLSLQQPTGDDASSTPEDLIPDPSGSLMAPDSPALIRELIAHALTRLSPDERDVIALRYGLHAGSPLTQEATARHLNLSRDRIRQLESSALQKMRAESQK